MTTTLNSVCKKADWSRPEFQRWLRELCPGDPLVQWFSPPKRVHRKHWEWIMGLLAMESEGLLRRDCTALGVASGHERICYLLTKYLSKVTATDLYGETVYSADEADPSVLAHPEKFAPFPYEKERLEFLNRNALDLKFSDASFDITFSYGSIEHFGGLEAAARALAEMARVTRPGGLVTVATEYLTPRGAQSGHPERFALEEIQHLRRSVASLEPIGEPDWDCPAETTWPIDPSKALLLRRKLGRLVGRDVPYILMTEGPFEWTSVHLAFRKK